ncbi:MAG: hypothetical protein GF383_07630 [Candidatus Lokiarchaeota archaeon]|nr:hypothetical protein [Candidatus Lokiarchaeota archaeon]MBD3340121.1 hypothetical protein [Candidatus Lokiarchaeota archaeon]
MEDPIDFYKNHGLLSSPGDYLYILEQTPEDLNGICDIMHNITAIDFLVNLGVFNIPKKHKSDVNIKSAANKLKALANRNANNKNTNGVFKNKLFGNCRDISLLLCASLRHKGIPSRIRSGFATFFAPIKKFDHWVCEYWDETSNDWKRIDLWMHQVQKHLDKIPAEFGAGMAQIDINPLNVGKSFFLTGGEAWSICRNNSDDPKNYGTYEPGLEGLWFIRDNMIRDLFCLNKIEMQAWDCWGIMGRENAVNPEKDNNLLDKVARDTTEQRISLETINTLCNQLGKKGFPDKWI